MLIYQNTNPRGFPEPVAAVEYVDDSPRILEKLEKPPSISPLASVTRVY